jgi:hypothetical protein
MHLSACLCQVVVLAVQGNSTVVRVLLSVQDVGVRVAGQAVEVVAARRQALLTVAGVLNVLTDGGVAVAAAGRIDGAAAVSVDVTVVVTEVVAAAAARWINGAVAVVTVALVAKVTAGVEAVTKAVGPVTAATETILVSFR